MPKYDKPRVLTLDIETAPIVANVWGTWKQNIAANQIVKDTTILSFAAKWLNSNRVYYYDTRDEEDERHDGNLMVILRDLLNQADIVVVHNGKAFDLPRIRTRMVGNGIHPFSPVLVVDTLKVARKHFAFTKNTLEHLANTLGCTHKKLKHKKFPGMELWDECLAGNTDAWNEMKRYNKHDVIVLEEVYLRLLPWIEQHPNYGAFADKTVVGEVCRNCGGTHLSNRGYSYTNAGKYIKYQCKDCHHWQRGAKNLLSKEERTRIAR